MRRPITLALAIPIAILAASAAAAIEPGEWQSSSRMTDITLPGNLPEQVGEMMRRQLNERVMSSTQCITQEDIEQAPEQMFEMSEGQCEYSDFQMSGGRLNAVAQCNMPQGAMTMTMTGEYTDTTYTMTMVMEGDSGMGNMAITSEVEGERIGPCA